MASLFRRKPVLLGADDLPAGFAYPDELVGLITGQPLRNWEWLAGERLRKASANLWLHHPRFLVPVAVRNGTRFVVCLDHSRVGPLGHEVVTIDALDDTAEPVQHLPSLLDWVAAALAEERPPAPAATDEPVEPGEPLVPGVPAPPVAWIPPETGRCGCVHHLDEYALAIVPFGSRAPSDEPPRTVGDLLLAQEVVAEPDYPGPPVTFRKRPVGPFHWKVSLVDGARWHYDDDPRLSFEMWLQPNPGVELVFSSAPGVLHLNAPTLCREGVQTLVVRALLDDRLRHK